MAYGLRKMGEDGMHHNFQWSLEVGASVECPDWDPNPECGNGLHLLPNAQGNWGLLNGHYWVVVEYDDTDLVMIDEDKGKVPKCKIVEVQDPDNLNPDKLLSYFDISKFDSRGACKWALNIGNRDVMIDRITESPWALEWARAIGNRDVMIDRVAEPQSVYWWARIIGNRDIMIDRITESEWAFWWGKKIGNRDIMIDRVTESEWAFWWGKDIGNRDIMRSRITDPYWIDRWNEWFPGDQIET